MSATSQQACPKCGKSVNAASRFCKYCAFDFSTIAATKPPDAIFTTLTAAPASTGKSKHQILIGGVVAGLVTILLVALLVYNRKTTPIPSLAATSTPVPNNSSTMGSRSKQTEEKILRGEFLNESDVAGLSIYELRILRNVHFARYGRKYERPGLGDYFYTCSWYQPRDDYSSNMITDTDNANIKVIATAEDNNIASHSRDWDSFWSLYKNAVQKRERSTLRMMMSSDFTYSFGDTSTGDPRDNAFRFWDKPDISGWTLLDEVLAKGVVNDTVATQGSNRETRIAPPSAANEGYMDIRAVFERGDDGRWRWVAFVSGD